jgi:hypothetical protein
LCSRKKKTFDIFFYLPRLLFRQVAPNFSRNFCLPPRRGVLLNFRPEFAFPSPPNFSLPLLFCHSSRGRTVNQIAHKTHNIRYQRMN